MNENPTPTATPGDEHSRLADTLRRDALLAPEPLSALNARAYLAERAEGTPTALLALAPHAQDGDTLEDLALISDLLGVRAED